MRWLRDVCAYGIVHSVVMVQCWRLRARCSSHILGLLLLVIAAAFRCRHGDIGSALVGRMIQECSNVVHKERVEQLCNFLFVRKIKRAIERYPNPGQPCSRSESAR